MLFQTPTPPPAPPPMSQVFDFPALHWYQTISPQALTLISLGVVVGVVIIFYPLMRALARRLEGRAAPDAALMAEVESLRQRVAELEQVPHHVAELEERLDFAERLLGQQREAPRIPREGA